MALRLGTASTSTSTSTSTSSSTSSSTPSTFRPFFDRLVEDGRITMGQKTDAVKTLSLVLKNAVIDPLKSKDPKYRQLKLHNVKLQQRLFSIPVVMDILTTVGFQQQTVDGEACLVLPLEKDASTLGQECVAELAMTQQRLAFIAGDTSNAKPVVPEKLSEKQKARKLLEEKEKLEKTKAKENRKRNLALLKADKHTRENDPNWKPGVSAACAKSGTGISTFRDKYGEGE
ncbi:unnamed protein product [Cylindrotheca closterium]|uniref:PUB domain-containing protein n=1 Tax=Cylindrotheca closterium TaxID=2856 RepID=A0AAD2CV13_9STRA|nr:unnamed protein product [Cylindrotheca closterium]